MAMHSYTTEDRWCQVRNEETPRPPKYETDIQVERPILTVGGIRMVMPKTTASRLWQHVDYCSVCQPNFIIHWFCCTLSIYLSAVSTHASLQYLLNGYSIGHYWSLSTQHISLLTRKVEWVLWHQSVLTIRVEQLYQTMFPSQFIHRSYHC